MQESPLLTSGISENDINDEARNENYSKQINILFNEIMEDLMKNDISNTGHISEQELLDILQKKLPPGKQLNIPLFQKLFQDIDKNIDMNIDLNDFCKKYIHAHEELKLNYEILQKGLEKEKNLKLKIESNIEKVKQERLNENGISPNSCVSTIIGKITFLSQINCDSIYFIVSLDENEKKTMIKNVENPNFTEKITFKIQDKQSTLSYKLYSSETNQFIGCSDVPLYIINIDNEEFNPEFELRDDNNQSIAVFKPKIIVVTSYFEMYQKNMKILIKILNLIKQKLMI